LPEGSSIAAKCNPSNALSGFSFSIFSNICICKGRPHSTDMMMSRHAYQWKYDVVEVSKELRYDVSMKECSREIYRSLSAPYEVILLWIYHNSIPS
jgi:hypothetical protein